MSNQVNEFKRQYTELESEVNTEFHKLAEKGFVFRKFIRALTVSNQVIYASELLPDVSGDDLWFVLGKNGADAQLPYKYYVQLTLHDKIEILSWSN